MSAEGRKHAIGAPLRGVRRDIDEIVQDPNMMPFGVNVVTMGGAVRPRCSHSREGFGEQTTDWSILANYAMVAVGDSWMFGGGGPDGNNWDWSSDHGETWGDATVTYDTIVLSDSLISIFKLGETDIVYGFSEQGRAWIADFTGFAGTIQFELLGFLVDADDGAAMRVFPSDPMIYDDQADMLWLHPHIAGSCPLMRIGGGAAVMTAAAWPYAIKASNGVKGVPVVPPPYDEFIPRPSSEWRLKGAGILDTVEAGFTGPVALLTNIEDPTRVEIVDQDQTLRGEDLDTYIHFAASRSFRTVKEIIRCVCKPEYIVDMLFDDRYQEYDVKTGIASLISPTFSSGSFIDYKIHDSTSMILLGDINVRTVDSWATYQEHEGIPFVHPGDAALHSSESSGWPLYFVERVRWPGNTVLLQELWDVSGNDGTTSDHNPHGDVTGIYQCSLDTEEFAFFTGTTSKMRHLDRLAEEWDDITNTTESTDPNAGVGALPIGTLGENPWVFRSFETGGSKHMVAVNGQVQPQCYKSSYSKMRMLGDPNFDDEIEETAPPAAHCLAVANNRLVLGVRPHNLYFSRPHDLDVGYDDFEVLLNDTEGDLVCLNEIGAAQLVAFKTDAMYHGQSQVAFMGTSAPMNFRRVKKGVIGPCSPQSVAYLPDGRLVYLGRDGGAYAYDAVIPQDLGRHIRALVRDDIDPDRYGSAWTMVDTQRSLVYFFYPTIDGLDNRGIVCSYDMGVPWPAWQFALPASWTVVAGMTAYFKRGAMLGSFPGMTLGDFPGRTLGSFTDGGHFQQVIVRKDGTWYRQNWLDSDEYTDAGRGINCSWGNGWINFDEDDSTYKQLHEAHHVAELNGVSITIEAEAERFSGKKISDESVIHDGMTRLKTTHRLTGRRHRFRFNAVADAIFYYARATAVELPRGHQ